MAGYHFSLPDVEKLSPSQQAAVGDSKPIALSGGPGTGKSVVAIYRHITNYQKQKPIRSQLITHTKSLAHYLKQCCSTISPKAAEFVDTSSSTKWRPSNGNIFDEIIHDEAQDLHLNFNKLLQKFAGSISYGADDQQLISAAARNEDGSYNLEECSPEKELRKIYTNSLHTLTKNYRSTRKIMMFVKNIFENAYIPEQTIIETEKEGDLYPTIFVTKTLDAQNQTILNIVEQFKNNKDINIAILAPYAKSAEEHLTPYYYYQLLKSKGFDCSYLDSSKESSVEIMNIHCTTFKSCKGLEFDLVIIPNFTLNFLSQTNTFITWMDFYVGATRAKSMLYIIGNHNFPKIPDTGQNKLAEKEFI